MAVDFDVRLANPPTHRALLPLAMQAADKLAGPHPKRLLQMSRSLQPANTRWRACCGARLALPLAFFAALLLSLCQGSIKLAATLHWGVNTLPMTLPVALPAAGAQPPIDVILGITHHKTGGCRWAPLGWPGHSARCCCCCCCWCC